MSITRQLADEENLPVQAGALVGGRDQNDQAVPGVKAGTPAAQAGIKDGDIITSVDGKVIDDGHPLDATLAQFSPGRPVDVEILRNGETITLDVTLGTRPANLIEAGRGGGAGDTPSSVGLRLGVAPQAPARLGPAGGATVRDRVGVELGNGGVAASTSTNWSGRTAVRSSSGLERPDRSDAGEGRDARRRRRRPPSTAGSRRRRRGLR